MIVYVDVLFFINFIMNSMIISMTADIMPARPKTFRIILSSIISSILGVLFFIPDFNMTGSVMSSAIIALTMSTIAFFPCKISMLVKRTLVIYLSSIIFAGASVFDMMLFDGGVIKNGFFYIASPRLILVAAIVYIASKLLFSRLKRRASQKIFGVILEYKENKVHTQGLIDTGNSLFDPITKKPVILIETKLLGKLIDKNCTPSNLCEWIDSERIRLIPYHTIDNNGYLTGIRLDRIFINGRQVESAIAAICEKEINYPVILHSGM